MEPRFNSYYIQIEDEIYPIYGANDMDDARKFFKPEEFEFIIETAERAFMHVTTGLVKFESEWESLDEVVEVIFCPYELNGLKTKNWSRANTKWPSTNYLSEIISLNLHKIFYKLDDAPHENQKNQCLTGAISLEYLISPSIRQLLNHPHKLISFQPTYPTTQSIKIKTITSVKHHSPIELQSNLSFTQITNWNFVYIKLPNCMVCIYSTITNCIYLV
jgi:hypothetical protein